MTTLLLLQDQPDCALSISEAQLHPSGCGSTDPMVRAAQHTINKNHVDLHGCSILLPAGLATGTAGAHDAALNLLLPAY